VGKVGAVKRVRLSTAYRRPTKVSQRV